MNKLGIELYSCAMYSSWCYHQPTRTLFDAGEGIALHLKARIFGIERIMLSHGHSDHINSLFSIIGLRAKTKGDTEKPLEIYYPADNYQFNMVRNYITASWSSLPYELKWIPIEPGFELRLDGAHSLRAFAMNHQRATTLGYKVVEKRLRLKPEFRGQDIPVLLKSGAVKKTELNDSYTANTFAYCLDHFNMNVEDILDCNMAIMDCTFLQDGDRDDKSHAMIQESIDVCAAARVKHMIAAHISVRYSHGFNFDKMWERLKIPVDMQVTLCDNTRVLEL